MVRIGLAAVYGGEKNEVTWLVPSSNSSKLSSNDQTGSIQIFGLLYFICGACLKLMRLLKK